MGVWVSVRVCVCVCDCVGEYVWVRVFWGICLCVCFSVPVWVGCFFEGMCVCVCVCVYIIYSSPCHLSPLCSSIRASQAVGKVLDTQSAHCSPPPSPPLSPLLCLVMDLAVCSVQGVQPSPAFAVMSPSQRLQVELYRLLGIPS